MVQMARQQHFFIILNTHLPNHLMSTSVIKILNVFILIYTIDV